MSTTPLIFNAKGTARTTMRPRRPDEQPNAEGNSPHHPRTGTGWVIARTGWERHAHSDAGGRMPRALAKYLTSWPTSSFFLVFLLLGSSSGFLFCSPICKTNHFHHYHHCHHYHHYHSLHQLLIPFQTDKHLRPSWSQTEAVAVLKMEKLRLISSH